MWIERRKRSLSGSRKIFRRVKVASRSIPQSDRESIRDVLKTLAEAIILVIIVILHISAGLANTFIPAITIPVLAGFGT